MEVPPDVEPVGCDHVGLTLDEELRLLPRDVGHRREHVGQVGAGAFDAVPDGGGKLELNYLTSCSHNQKTGSRRALYKFES